MKQKIFMVATTIVVLFINACTLQNKEACNVNEKHNRHVPQTHLYNSQAPVNNQDLNINRQNVTMPWAKEKPSLEESEEFVRQAAANWILKKDEEPYLPLLIFDKKDNTLIGTTGFHHVVWEVPCLEMGYWIRNQYSGQGYMTEAVNAITQYAFKQLHMKGVAITCGRDNIRSKKIPERLGFHLEGALKANRIKPITGDISDTLIFAKYDLNNLPSLVVNWEKT
jgi:ribosomal-protein-serine acetyltransferase